MVVIVLGFPYLLIFNRLTFFCPNGFQQFSVQTFTYIMLLQKMISYTLISFLRTDTFWSPYCLMSKEVHLTSDKLTTWPVRHCTNVHTLFSTVWYYTIPKVIIKVTAWKFVRIKKNNSRNITQKKIRSPVIADPNLNEKKIVYYYWFCDIILVVYRILWMNLYRTILSGGNNMERPQSNIYFNKWYNDRTLKCYKIGCAGSIRSITFNDPYLLNPESLMNKRK